MKPAAVVFLAMSISTSAGAAIDVLALWDFAHPEVSEQRFRDALAAAQGDDRLILQTQIARTYGLRKDFAKAKEVLAGIAPAVADAGPEARARYQLELGRAYASATHTPEQLTPEAKQRARHAYAAAIGIAEQAHLDGLVVDGVHMMAFVDDAPADQLKWAERALAVVKASRQPQAVRWEASIRNNMGMALHGLGRLPEALEQFQQALALREKGTDAEAVRVARWMIAWTLRTMGRGQEALETQLQLERENEAAGQPDVYVFEELETLYRAAGDEVRAAAYAAKKKQAGGQP